MTANHEHTPTREQFKALLARIPAKYGEVIAHTAVLDDFDRMIDQTIAAAEQRGASIVLRDLASSLIAGHEPDADTRIFDPWDVAEMLRYRANKADEERARLEGRNE